MNQIPLKITGLTRSHPSLQLLLQAGCSLRGAAATLALLAKCGILSGPQPCASTIRGWLLREGLGALNEPLDKRQSWALLVDHTLQVGSLKMLAILGCPMKDVPFGERALRLADLRLAALVPMKSSTGETMLEQLEAAAERTGVPRLIVSDQGPDLVKAIAAYQARHPETAAVPDAAHFGANVLKRAWSKEERWAEFLRQLQQTAAQLRQTDEAHFTPPKLRAQSRFMNVGAQLRFADKVLRHLEGGSPSPKAAEHYAWLPGFRDELAVWLREQGLVQAFVAQLRQDGLHVGTQQKLDQAWRPLDDRASTQHIAAQLRDYVAQYRPDLPGEKFVASTEILESSFGKLKRLEHSQSHSGFTPLALALGAIVGSQTPEETGQSLDQTPIKQVTAWARATLGRSVQWLRRQFLGSPAPSPEAPTAAPDAPSAATPQPLPNLG